VLDNGWASTVGDDGKHLRFKVHQQDNSTINFGAIGFNLGDKLELISSGKPFNICYTIEENHWNDQTTLQLNIKDIQA
jgi:single-stranded-DNA-specific exonuclease